MQENYVKSLTRILVYEGGKVNDPHDPGGRTNQGVTQATYTAWLSSNKRPNADVYNISAQDVSTIYKGEYWDRIQGDALPTGLDLCVFDASVNSGCGQASKWLQQALGSAYQGQIDGTVGSKTLAAIQSEPGDCVDIIEAFCSRRLATLQRLSTWKYFGQGWHARIANVQKTAISWVDVAPEPQAPDLSSVKGSAKAPVTGHINPPMVSQIAAHATTAASGTVVVATQAAQQLQPLSDTFSWIKYVFGGLTLLAIGAGVVAKISQSAKDAAEAGSATATVNLEADAGLPSLTPAPGQKGA